MASCEIQLSDLVKRIEPTQTQKDGAKRSHNYLRDILCTGQMASRITNHYLSGSYSRDTAIYPLDDVDVIFEIDQNKWNRGFLSLYNPSPEAVLDSFANAIRYRYPESTVYRQRRSVRLSLYHLDIDVVPAIKSGDYIWIPDREADDWIKSSPSKHSENATNLNRLQNGKFKPLVKLLKFWNSNLPTTAKLKSFAVETICIRLFRTVKFNSLEEGLLHFFDFVAYLSGNETAIRWNDSCDISFSWLLGCNVPDAADTGSNTASGVDEERRKRFIENAVRCRERMVEAKNAISNETAWRRAAEAFKIK